MARIPIAGPWITELEVDYVRHAAETAWYDSANTIIEHFESNFATYTQRRHAISLPSCTAGIHLVLAALGIGPGDEVIVPDITWIASAAPVSYVGARTVFADVDALTWCIRADAIEQLITPRTKAIVAVDLYGGMPDMNAVAAVASSHRIHLIEDSAEAIGSAWEGLPAGAFGVASVFSFHGSKTLTTGEGGMVVTSDDSLYERMLQLRDHGRRPGDTEFFNFEIAFKYKMSSLQAALGLAQLERLEALVDRKRQLFEWYASELGARSDLTLNAEPPRTRNSYWMVTAVTHSDLAVNSKTVRQALLEDEIETRPFFHPLSSLPAYMRDPEAEAARERNQVSYSISPRGLNLPSALMLTEADVHRVATALQKVLETGAIVGRTAASGAEAETSR